MMRGNAGEGITPECIQRSGEESEEMRLVMQDGTTEDLKLMKVLIEEELTRRGKEEKS